MYHRVCMVLHSGPCLQLTMPGSYSRTPTPSIPSDKVGHSIMDESEDVDKLNQFHFGAECDSPPQCIPLLFTEPVHSGHTMPATHRPWMLQAARRAATGHPSTNHLILEMVPPSGHWCVPARIWSLSGIYVEHLRLGL